jgi:hypothetical protein
MMALQGDDSPYIRHSGLTTANTAELDPMKKQAMQGTLKPVEYTPAPINNPQQAAAPAAGPTQPTAPAAPQAAPAQQAAPAPTQPTQPQQTTEEELEEELQKILRLSGRQKQTTNENDSFKKFYSILNESSDKTELTESIELHDSFDIELNEHFVIETGIIGFTEDGIIIEADETLLGLLEVNNILCEEESTQSKPDTNKKDKPSDNYIDTKPATDTNIDTSKLIDKEPLKAKPLKGDPKDYIAKEGYEDETMMSVYQDHKTTQKDGKVSSDFSSKSFSRNPKTGTGSYLISRDKDGEVTQDFQQNVSKPWMDYTEKGGQGPMSQFRASVNEAEYQGRKVPLGKPMAGDVAKSKVYVKKPNGKVVKVNFGDKNMKIKKSNPNRRKSFRARHRCENPGPRWKARYWSCRAW